MVNMFRRSIVVNSAVPLAVVVMMVIVTMIVITEQITVSAIDIHNQQSGAVSQLLIASNEVNIDDAFESILFDLSKSKAKSFDLEVWNALAALNTTLQKYSEFRATVERSESEAIINSRIGVFLFTRYCGPGSRILNKIFRTDERTYASIDICCQMHDECPHYVKTTEDYGRYPGLEVRPQFFSRLQCKCDANFYQCLQNINAPYAYSVSIGYGIFQRFCFEYEHPILNCTQYYSGFGLRRCITYELDYKSPKVWQWFDVLPSFLNIYEFPQFIQSSLKNEE